MIYDLCIIGGGIVGLACAYKFAESHPGAAILVLEKEAGLGRHQTGHNSGVIHSGIYYAPGSFKAELCRRGVAETTAFCDAHGIPYIACGKMIVATSEAERARMEQLYERASQNKVEAERLDAAELRRREPNITGIGAIFVPSTGIVDYKRICHALADDIRKARGEITLNAEVATISERFDHVVITAGDRDWQARYLIACGGLQSDRLARLAGLSVDFQIVPFRGEYYRLPPEKNGIVSTLIYPVPDPALPFLGIHLTRMIDGGVTVGPSAVLGWAREGYPKFSFSARDTATFLGFPGFWRVIGAHLKSGLAEMRNSLFRQHYLAECRKYCPSLTLGDLGPQEAGIRAQAVLRDGTLVHDFLFRETERMLHVCNAPSPAATSALPIGSMIVERLTRKMAARPAAATA
jgi:L-2-hydroxyglutarate oxidase